MKKNSDQTTDLYNEIYKNAAMGAGTVKHLLAGKRSEEMSETLRKQYAEYLAVCRSASSAQASRGEKIKGLSGMAKMRTDVGVSLNTLFDRSDAHVAKLMMNGGVMGVINAEKKLNECPQADEKAKDLMRHLSDYELSTIDIMKSYL